MMTPNDEIFDIQVIKQVMKKFEKKERELIRKIMRVGDFDEFIASEQMPSFNVGGSEIQPERVVTNKLKGKAQEGDGWNVILKVQDAPPSKVKVFLELILKNCEYDIKVIDPDEDVFTFHLSEAESGLLQIPIFLNHPKKGYYAIEIKIATSPLAKKNFEAGVSAVWVEFLSEEKKEEK